MAEVVSDNEWLHSRILAEAMDLLRRRQYETTPAELVTELFLRTGKTLGLGDPYKSRKRTWQAEVKAALPELRRKVKEAPDPLALAVRYSALANVFDDELVGEIDLAGLFEAAERLPLREEVWEEFEDQVAQAQKVVFLHDSAGEIVADQLLIELMANKEVVSVVRPEPIGTKATVREAQELLKSALVSQVIDPGVRSLGTPLSQASQKFKDLISEADLVIAKGQANFETLAPEERGFYFLFRVKCPVMAENLAAQQGDLVLEKA